ncbi:hypothetical protein KC950_01270 [Candidatus Saccharibacteria bacterium]|nr:hypothetical protein [Candidatus Saccharibacteria bacterium]
MVKKKLKTIKNKVKNKPLLTGIVIWYVFMWSWVLFTDTLDLAGNKTQGFIVALIVLAFNVALSTVIIWQGFRVAKWLLKKYPSWIVITLVPLFALADWLVAWIPAALWIGPQGRLDSVLPLATPSLLVINTPLGFGARFVGFFGLAGFFWATIALIANKNYRKLAYIPVTILVAFSFIGWLAYKTPNGVDFKATIISENLDDHVPPVDNQSDLVVFPEYGMDEITNDNLDERLARISDSEHKTFFLGSQQIFPEDGQQAGHLNTLLYGNSIDGITLAQDKYRLIPGGEDLPYLLRTGLRATNQKDTLDYFSYAKGVIKGSQQLQPLKVNDDVIVGAAVCSSIISPQDYREFTSNGATVLSNSASLTIFKGSPLFAWQQKSFAKFMAIANSRYFLQSANAARAYMLDNNGTTKAEESGTKIINVTATTNTAKTPYTLIGDWLPALGALMASYLIFRHKYIAKKPKKKTKTKNH